MTVYDDATNAVVGMVPVAVGVGLLNSMTPHEKQRTRVIVLKAKKKAPPAKLPPKIKLKSYRPHTPKPPKPVRFGKMRRYAVRGGTVITRRKRR